MKKPNKYKKIDKDILIYMLRSNFVVLFSSVFSADWNKYENKNNHFDYFNLLNNDSIVEYKSVSNLIENDTNSFRADILRILGYSSLLGVGSMLFFLAFPMSLLFKLLLSFSIFIFSFISWFKISLAIKNIIKLPINHLSLNLYDISSYKPVKYKNKKMNDIYSKHYFLNLNDKFDYENTLLKLMYLESLMDRPKNKELENLFNNLKNLTIFKSSLLSDRYKQNFKEKTYQLKNKQSTKLKNKDIDFLDVPIPYIDTLNYSKLYVTFIILNDEIGLAIFKKHQLLLEIIINFLELQKSNPKNLLNTDEFILLNDINNEINLFKLELEDYLNKSFSIKENSVCKRDSEKEYESKLEILKLAMNTIKKD